MVSLGCSVANHGEATVALRSYGVLKGKAIEVRVGAGQSPHYQVRIVDDTTDYRIAVNVKSQLAPSDLEFLVIEHFQHPITPIVEQLPKGFTAARAKAWLRSARLHQGQSLRPREDAAAALQCSLASTTTSTRSSISVMQRAVADENALVYAFGERWGPERARRTSTSVSCRAMASTIST
jgi:uncharacterized protein YukJ